MTQLPPSCPFTKRVQATLPCPGSPPALPSTLPTSSPQDGSGARLAVNLSSGLPGYMPWP